MPSVTELKAYVYDLLAQRQAIEKELQRVNEEILKAQKEKEVEGDKDKSTESQEN